MHPFLLFTFSDTEPVGFRVSTDEPLEDDKDYE